MAAEYTMSPSYTTQEHEDCGIHMLSKLVLKNIFKIEGDLSDECSQMLITDHRHYHNPEYIKLFSTSCKDTIVKAVMFLYIYQLINEQFPELCYRGIETKHLQDYVNYIQEGINSNHIPACFEGTVFQSHILGLIGQYLERPLRLLSGINHVSPNCFDETCMFETDHDRYIGCLTEHRETVDSEIIDYHGIIIAKIQVIPTNTHVFLKNSWGRLSNIILTQDVFFDGTYEWEGGHFLTPIAYVFLCNEEEFIGQCIDFLISMRLTMTDFKKLILTYYASNMDKYDHALTVIINEYSRLMGEHPDINKQMYDELVPSSNEKWFNRITAYVTTREMFEEIMINYKLTQEDVNFIWPKIQHQIAPQDLDFFDELPEGAFKDIGGKRKKTKHKKTKRKKTKRKSIKRQ